MNLLEFQNLYSVGNEEASQLFGCSRSTIQKWRAGAIQTPKVVENYIRLIHQLACCQQGVFEQIRNGSFKPGMGNGSEPEAFSMQGLCDWLGESTRVFAWKWFPDSTLAGVSRNFYQAFGLSSEFMQGRRWLDFIVSFSKRKEAEELLRAAVRRDSVLPRRLTFVLPGDRQVNFLMHNFQLEADTGRNSFASLLVDVTAEDEARMKMLAIDRTLESVYGNDPEPILVFLGNGRILSCNLRMRRLLSKLHVGGGDENIYMLLEQNTDREEVESILESLPMEGTVPVSATVKMFPGKLPRMVHGRLRRCDWKGVPGFIFSLGYGFGGKAHQTARRLAEHRLNENLGVLIRSPEWGSSHSYLYKDAQTWQQVQLLGRLHGAMRAYVFKYDETTDILSNSVEWCSAGVEPQIDALQHGRFSTDNPWWYEQMLRGEPVIAPVVANLPPQAATEKALLESQDIRALAAFPLWEDGKLSGFVGLDFSRTFESFEQTLLKDLRKCASVIGRQRRLLLSEADAKTKLSQASLFFNDAEIASYRWEIEKDVATVLIDSADLLRLPGGPGSELQEANVWFLRHVHPDDRPTVEESLRLFVTPGGDRTRFVYRFTHDFETYFRIEARLFVEKRSDKGVPVSAVTFLRPCDSGANGALPAAESGETETAWLARLAHNLKTPLHVLETLQSHGAYKKSDSVIREVLGDFSQQINAVIELADGLSNPDVPAVESVFLKDFASEILESLRQIEGDNHPSLELAPGSPVTLFLQRSWLLSVIGPIWQAHASRSASGLGSVCISFRPDGGDTGVLMVELKTYWKKNAAKDPQKHRLEGPLSLPGEGSNPRLELAYHRLRLIGGEFQIGNEYLLVQVPCKAGRWHPRGPGEESSVGMESILLVEDHELIRWITLQQLEKAGFRVASVTNGKEALQWLQQNTVDVVLLDIQMPVMNGFQFLDHYVLPEFAPHRAHCGVFVLSALEGARYRKELEQYPLLGILQKPFSVKALVKTLKGVKR